MTTLQNQAAAADPAADSSNRIVNIAEYLPRMAEAYPDNPAVVCPTGKDAAGRTTYKHLTFAQLNAETDRYAHGFSRAHITRGTRTILMVKPSLEFFTLTFALFKVGAVPVLVDPGMGRRRMVDCLAHVEAEAFIGIPLAHVARLLFRRAFKCLKVVVTVGRRWAWGGYALHQLRDICDAPFDIAPTSESDPAAILFTSGSTGPPKGALYRHGNFDAQVRLLQSHYGYGPDEIDLPTFPLFALFDAALGMTAIIPDMDASRPAHVDPENIITPIRDHAATHMFGSPALLNRVGRYANERNIKIPSLKRVITAGAPIQPSILECFDALLPPDALIHTPYGATEALPVASIDHREILRETAPLTATGAGTCVGKPLDGMTVRIIPIDEDPIERWSADLPLPANQIGEITVAGPVVTHEYFKDPSATKLAKIQDGDRIVHRMGDLGYFDDRGRLWFCGRKAHRVITETETLFTIPCEAIFNQHPAVARTALVGVGQPGRQTPVLCVERESTDVAPDQKQLTGELLALGQANDKTKSIRTFLVHPAFPVDVRHNAKIFREKLAVWAAERLQ
jgi:acyl-CoA synthetase (AMP-forming)/AMP-acid ligase II